MKKTLKSTIQGVLIAAAATSVVSSAQAAYTYQSLAGAYQQGDLLAGFTTASGNDLIVNLGLASALTANSAWNLSGLMVGNLAGATSLSWGVIGVSASTPNLVYSTVDTGGTPAIVHNLSGYNTVKTSANGIGTLITLSSGYATPAASAAGDLSWNGGTSVGGTDTWLNNYGNPNNQTTFNISSPGALYSEDFYASGYSPSVTQTLNANAFTLGNYGGATILSFGIDPVPEPSSYYLLSSGGLLLLALRRKFARIA